VRTRIAVRVCYPCDAECNGEGDFEGWVARVGAVLSCRQIVEEWDDGWVEIDRYGELCECPYMDFQPCCYQQLFRYIYAPLIDVGVTCQIMTCVLGEMMENGRPCVDTPTPTLTNIPTPSGTITPTVTGVTSTPTQSATVTRTWAPTQTANGFTDDCCTFIGGNEDNPQVFYGILDPTTGGCLVCANPGVSLSQCSEFIQVANPCEELNSGASLVPFGSEAFVSMIKEAFNEIQVDMRSTRIYGDLISKANDEQGFILRYSVGGNTIDLPCPPGPLRTFMTRICQWLLAAMSLFVCVRIVLGVLRRDGDK